MKVLSRTLTLYTRSITPSPLPFTLTLIPSPWMAKKTKKMRKSRFTPYGFQMAELRLNSFDSIQFLMFRILEKAVSNQNPVWNETGLDETGFE